MKIIDSHAHVGEFENKLLSEEHLLNSLEKYHIDFTLVCHTSGMEFNSNKEPIKTQSQLHQAIEVIKLCKKSKNKVGALLWMKPYSEDVTTKLSEFIKEHRNYIYGLKFHPYHSQTNFNDHKMDAYFELAKEHNLPIVTHTATSYESSSKQVYKVAKNNPEINFVLVHMDLGSDHTEAMTYISMLDNLYGDTTWVDYESTIKAIKLCGKDKILFGSDNTIDGEDTLGKEFYQHYFSTIKQHLSSDEYEHLMYKNAKLLFGIEEV